MLEELEIRDFALIEHLRVRFTRGLNVLTGETGAGKSILIDALNAVLGGKVGPAVLRPGLDKASIEATFAETPEISGWLKQQELKSEDLDRLIVSREIGKNGSRSRINGTLVNSALLSELRQMLLSMHAQHEARTLLSPQSQLEMLDDLGNEEHLKLKEKVRTLYARKKELSFQLAELQISEDERIRLLDFARYQLTELNDATLSDQQEDEKVANDCRVLEHVGELESCASEAQRLLAGDDAAEAACVVDILQEALVQMERACQMDSSLSNIAESLGATLETVAESARAVRRYKDKLDTDPETLSSLQSRLNQLAAIKRKYGPTIADAIARRDDLTAQIEKLDGAQDAIEKLSAELATVEACLSRAASGLSTARHKLAKKLGSDIQSVLFELGMERCRFEISCEVSEIGPNGGDRIDFLISPNPGQQLLPVAKIASGGELSRVMLAIKSIFASADRVATVVFDEIDTGLSGRTLQSVRDKLARLAASHQILCITHQPIIASVADNHILVSKKQTAKSTSISVSTLSEEERTTSLAEMASGQTDQEEALRFARLLIEDGNRLRSCKVI